MKIIWLLLIIIVVLSCSLPDNFGLPSWYTNHKLKIINDDWAVNELAEHDSTLIIINDTLKFHTAIDASSEVGEIEIEQPDERIVPVSLEEIAPESIEQYDGETVPEIPAFIMEPISKNFEEFSEFEVISFSEAQLKLIITNNTMVYLGNEPEHPLKAVLMDYTTNDTLLTRVLDNDIPPGGTNQQNISLAGYTFPNTIKIRITGGSKGSNGEETTVNLDSTFDINLIIESIKADYVIADIPEQSVETIEGSIPVGTEYPEFYGDFAIVSNSSITFNFNIPIAANIDVKLIAINDENRDTLRVNNQIPMIAAASGNSSVTYYSTESNLNDLLSILPEHFEYSLDPVVGSEQGVLDTLYSTNSIGANIDILTDLNIAADCWIIPYANNQADVDKIDTKDFDIDKYEGFQSGGIAYQYLNNTGAEAGLDILISKNDFENDQEILNPDSSVTVITIPNLEGTTGENFNDGSIDITEDDLKDFLADSVFVARKLYFYSDAMEPISGHIHLKGELNLELLISEDLVSE